MTTHLEPGQRHMLVTKLSSDSCAPIPIPRVTSQSLLEHIHSGSLAASEKLLKMAAASQAELADRVQSAMEDELLHASLFGASSPKQAQSLQQVYPAAAPALCDRDLLPGGGLRSFCSSRSCSQQCSNTDATVPLNLADVEEEELFGDDGEDVTAVQEQQRVPAVADLPLARHDSRLERRIQLSIAAKWGGGSADF